MSSTVEDGRVDEARAYVELARSPPTMADTFTLDGKCLMDLMSGRPVARFRRTSGVSQASRVSGRSWLRWGQVLPRGKWLHQRASHDCHNQELVCLSPSKHRTSELKGSTGALQARRRIFSPRGCLSPLVV